MAKDNITEALDSTMDMVDSYQRSLRKESKKAFQAGDYRSTSTLIANMGKIESLQKQLRAVQKDWGKINIEIGGVKIIEAPKTTKKALRVRGKRTPETDFRLPILQTLVDLGGTAKTAEVLNAVEKKMKKTLNEYDMQPLPSIPSMSRWKQTAQMVRIKMVKEGLLKSSSPRGVWEITAKGKRTI